MVNALFYVGAAISTTRSPIVSFFQMVMINDTSNKFV